MSNHPVAKSNDADAHASRIRELFGPTYVPIQPPMSIREQVDRGIELQSTVFKGALQLTGDGMQSNKISSYIDQHHLSREFINLMPQLSAYAKTMLIPDAEDILGYFEMLRMEQTKIREHMIK